VAVPVERVVAKASDASARMPVFIIFSKARIQDHVYGD